jgi:hypothetical protein
VGGEGHHAELAQVGGAHALLRRLRAQHHIGLGSLEGLGDRAQLARRVAQPRQSAHELHVHRVPIATEIAERDEAARISRSAAECGIAEADERLRRLGAPGHRAEALERAGGGQNADRHLPAEERHLAIVRLLGRTGRRLARLGHEEPERQAEKRPRRHDDEVRRTLQPRRHRREQIGVEALGGRDVEGADLAIGEVETLAKLAHRLVEGGRGDGGAMRVHLAVVHEEDIGGVPW